MTLYQRKVLHMAKLRDRIRDQEPVVDSLLTRLVQSPHTAEILFVIAAVAAAAGVLWWLLP